MALSREQVKQNIIRAQEDARTRVRASRSRLQKASVENKTFIDNLVRTGVGATAGFVTGGPVGALAGGVKGAMAEDIVGAGLQGAGAGLTAPSLVSPEASLLEKATALKGLAPGEDSLQAAAAIGKEKTRVEEKREKIESAQEIAKTKAESAENIAKTRAKNIGKGLEGEKEKTKRQREKVKAEAEAAKLKRTASEKAAALKSAQTNRRIAAKAYDAKLKEMTSSQRKKLKKNQAKGKELTRKEFIDGFVSDLDIGLEEIKEESVTAVSQNKSKTAVKLSDGSIISTEEAKNRGLI